MQEELKMLQKEKFPFEGALPSLLFVLFSCFFGGAPHASKAKMYPGFLLQDMTGTW